MVLAALLRSTMPASEQLGGGWRGHLQGMGKSRFYTLMLSSLGVQTFPSIS